MESILMERAEGQQIRSDAGADGWKLATVSYITLLQEVR